MNERSRIIAMKREPKKQSIKVIKNRLLHATKVSPRNDAWMIFYTATNG